MHEGHRQRMYEKLKTGDRLFDHELLEMLLFNACPRKNTNPIAHALLDSFGSLAGVFSADIEQLMTVKGVGESIALYIKCNAEILQRANTVSTCITGLKTYEELKDFAVVRMRGRRQEVLELYFLEKNGNLKRILSFTNDDVSRVEVKTRDIAAAIAAEKPYGILVAHNHLSGSSAPSVNDDRFTQELQLLCSFHDVILYDHCIYASDNNVYSYFSSGKIDGIRRDFSFKGLIDAKLKTGDEEKKDKK